MGDTTGGNLATDLANNALPNFAFLAPNLCNDMHDCSVSTGDAWLKKWLTKIVASPAYSNGTTAVLVSFDEGSGGTHGEDCASTSNNDNSCLIATYVLGPAVKAGTRVATRLTHYSALRATESMLGLTTYLGNAATAPSMRTPFRL
jgi:phospholipase C